MAKNTNSFINNSINNNSNEFPLFVGLRKHTVVCDLTDYDVNTEKAAFWLEKSGAYAYDYEWNCPYYYDFPHEEWRPSMHDWKLEDRKNAEGFEEMTPFSVWTVETYHKALDGVVGLN